MEAGEGKIEKAKRLRRKTEKKGTMKEENWQLKQNEKKHKKKQTEKGSKTKYLKWKKKMNTNKKSKIKNYH